MNLELEHPYTALIWDFAQKEHRFSSNQPKVQASFRNRINSILMLAGETGGKLTTWDLLQKLSISSSTATECFKLMADAGVLERVQGRNRAMYYFVVPIQKSWDQNPFGETN